MSAPAVTPKNHVRRRGGAGTGKPKMKTFGTMSTMALAAAVAAGAAFAGTARPAAAQSAEAFYKGLSDIRLIISAGAGGGYSVYGRNLARHMPDHIPGNPNIVVQNMPGGGGIKATNYLYNGRQEGRLCARPDPFERADGAALRHPRRQVRRHQVQLARQHEHGERHLRRLAHRADQDTGTTC